MIESKLEKCAIVMMALGEEAAAEVIKHLSADEVQELSGAMATLSPVTRVDVLDVLEEFQEESNQFMAVQLGSTDYISEVLVRALGQDRAAGIIEDIMEATAGSSGIEALNSLEPSSIAELISGEHPQIIATILVHLERDRAAGVLSLLSERLRNDVVIRVATFGGVQPSALHDLTDTFNSVLSGQGAKRSKLGGVRTAAEMLNAMSSQQETSVLSSLQELDADLAQRIKDDMFTFDNLSELDRESIQLILREVQDASWALALKGADDTLINHILANMPKRAGDLLQEDMEAQGPVRISVIESERKKILAVARRLADKGEIILGGNGKDEYV